MELELGKSRRVTFYSIGGGEGLLLDRSNPKWQRRYLSEKFYIDNYFAGAK
jgi:Na+-transporting NADH:ubiquinone oxidoreductase subunit NqrC